jgi:hypothetical protein
MNELWEFDSEYWWKPEISALCFRGKKSGIRYNFGITQIALINCFQCNKDTKEAAIDMFFQNRDKIESVAKRYASEAKARDDSPDYLITQETYENFVRGLEG